MPDVFRVEKAGPLLQGCFSCSRAACGMRLGQKFSWKLLFDWLHPCLILLPSLPYKIFLWEHSLKKPHVKLSPSQALLRGTWPKTVRNDWQCVLMKKKGKDIAVEGMFLIKKKKFIKLLLCARHSSMPWEREYTIKNAPASRGKKGSQSSVTTEGFCEEG